MKKRAVSAIFILLLINWAICVCAAPPPDVSGRQIGNEQSVKNPLSLSTIASIDRVLLGEYAGEGESFRIKIIETIKDTYRISEIKKALSVPVLTRTPPSFIGSLYNLIFLDKNGKIVAAAIYRLTRFGYVLKLSPKAGMDSGFYFDYGPQAKELPGNWEPKIDYREYTISFNNWHEAIGYAPRW